MADRMTLQDQALALGAEDRAAIASALLHSLEPPSYDVSDEEVLNRLKQLEAREVKEISHEALMAQVKHHEESKGVCPASSVGSANRPR